MRRLVAALAVFVVTTAAGDAGAFAREAAVETSVRIDVEQSSFRLEQAVTIPLSRLFTSFPHTEDAGAEPSRLFMRHVVEPDGDSRWGASLSASLGGFSARLFIHEPHKSSPDPFRLYHSSVRAADASGVALTWQGPLRLSVQYVDKIPLRGLTGSLIALRAGSEADPLRWSAVLYGTERLRHRFVAVDGDTALGAARLSFGAARQDGVELTQATGGLLRRAVEEQALFAKLETAFGRNRAWLMVHDTSGGFRSLAAASYPFRRDALVVEGRWQWRPGTSRLLSVYGQRRLSREGGAADKLEAAFSWMPSGGWGARVELEGEWERGREEERGLSVTVTSPDRRFDQSVAVSWDAAGSRRRRLTVQWRGDVWRARLGVDDALPAWRLEWRWSPGPWEALVVYKQRVYPERGAVPWLYASVTYDVPDFGQWWIRWGESDNGRLDVGWSRPVVVGAGWRVVF